MYKPLAGFATRLTHNITATTRYVPIAEPDYEYLLSQLDSGDYTFLQLQDGTAIEVVKVRNICGILAFDRGVELTKPLSFRCGTGLVFVLTMQGVKDMVCQMDTCN